MSEFFPSPEEIARRDLERRQAAARAPEERRQKLLAIVREFLAKMAASGIEPPKQAPLFKGPSRGWEVAHGLVLDPGPPACWWQEYKDGPYDYAWQWMPLEEIPSYSPDPDRLHEVLRGYI